MPTESGIYFDESLTALKVRTAAIVPKLTAAVGLVVKTQVPKVQDYMRANAKWTDRTGNARQGLFARYSQQNFTHKIDVYHTVSYGIWLEVRWAGQYAIIVPTIVAEGARIMGLMRKLIDKMEMAA